MATLTQQVTDIKPVLAALGLKETNDGCSTGHKLDFASGDSHRII
jgi:hypothetical protein